MVTLTAIHYVYIIMTLVILVALIFKKEIVIPCILGVISIGFVYSNNVISTIQIVNNAIVESFKELLGVIVVIALVVSMSRAMVAIGADEIMIRPVRKIIRGRNMAFFTIGIAMMVVAWLIWPSPAVALIGALLLPVAAEVGLPALWAAVAMNIFGHGVAMSGDFVIQGAPSISSAAAGLEASDVISASVPLWAVMSITTVAVTFIMMRREMKKNGGGEIVKVEVVERQIKKPKLGMLMAILMPIAFVTDVILMIIFDIAGGDATALIASTALILMCIMTMAEAGFGEALEKSVDYLKEGFIFAIKIFAPVVVIASFFFMGSEGFAQSVLGENATGLLNDIGLCIAQSIPLNTASIATVQTGIGMITGLDGSGFSGLPLVGSIAQTFTVGNGLNTATLVALGQIAAIWVGGGTIIPWGVVPVAAICGVKPADLARKNMIPVLIGLGVTTVFAIFIL